MTKSRKPVEFKGSSLDDLKSFPSNVIKDMGHEIFLVQCGEDPSDWKPMTIIGPGVREIRVKSKDSIFRSIYVASLGDKIYVLHCFQKKTQKTPKSDIDIASQRLSALIVSLRKPRKRSR